ncbi:serine/threonine-protein kinase [Rhodobacteraceae bacterium D3-12]|nr:serine/threonine-protein kinase [Rhodobacteraceae bacterium D3-12]
MKDPMPTDIFKIGQVLNNTYEIIGILGRGGTGEVYLARNQINEREIAIKALNARFSQNDDYVSLMKREDQMRAILHDAVVRYIECSRSDQGHVFLVMDFIDGPSVNDVMRDRKLNDRELLVISHRVLEGLVPTHANGIVHRDLSPDNIILRGGDPERATIIDFGIAKDTTAGAMTIVGNDFAGKYEYAAPEQLEGHSDRRTDLYALGASLLAAYRRDIPFLGTTPGEIVRRKAEPLDLSGLQGPLRELIEWLTDPDPNRRPQSAEEALERLGGMLKPLEDRKDGKSGKRRSRRERKKRRSAVVPLLLGGLLLAGGLGAWLSGALDQLFEPPLPIADPYELRAAKSETGDFTFSAHAPDKEKATGLRAAMAEVMGRLPREEAITLAQGMPFETWPTKAGELVAIAAGLERWDVKLDNTKADVSGLATSRADKQRLIQELSSWSTTAGISVTPDIIAGPERLGVDKVQQALDRLSTCGRLEQRNAPAQSYAIYDAISISGDLAAAGDVDAIKAMLEPQIGDRTLRFETTILNEDLCAIRAVLPQAPSQSVSISLSHGKTGKSALTGVFRTGENPVVDILLPGNLNQGSLWVLVVDNTGKVFHVLPNINRTQHAVEGLGVLENGVRRVRVLWSLDEFLADQKRLAMQVTDSDYGKSEVIAILSREPLFDMRRPRDESVRSVAEALGAAVKSGETEIIGMASRILDARP